MDKIINYLLLTIIFVFDPLAISLVVAANFAFEQLKPKVKIVEKVIEVEKPLEVYGEKEEEIPPPPPPPIQKKRRFRMRPQT